jgi:hypothetical protein
LAQITLGRTKVVFQFSGYISTVDSSQRLTIAGKVDDPYTRRALAFGI